MGTLPLPSGQSFIECNEDYREEVLLKNSLLQEDHHYYFQSTENTESAQWEALEKIVTTLAHYAPEHFVLNKNGNAWQWENKILDETCSFIFGDSATLPRQPLDWVGRQVQEDLILLNKESMLVCGQLCFPSGWCLDEKIGKHFLDVHAPLPNLLNTMISTAGNFIQRIPVDKIIVRNNWGFRVGNQLDLSSRHSEEYYKILNETGSNLTLDTIGEHVYLRVEHQTLSRLPISGYILFTIHTYHSQLNEEALHTERMNVLSSFLKTIPPALMEYKLMTPFAKTLIEFVDHHNKK